MIATRARGRLRRCRGSPTCRCSRCRSCCCPASCCRCTSSSRATASSWRAAWPGPEPFCVVLEDDAGVREVGCLARDLTVLERLADGRLNVVVSGGEPVRLGPLDDEAHSYLSAEATAARGRRGAARRRGDRGRAGGLPARCCSDIGREDRRAADGPAAPLLRARRAHRRGRSRSGRRCSRRARRGARLVLITEALEQGGTACAAPPSASGARCGTARSIRGCRSLLGLRCSAVRGLARGVSISAGGWLGWRFAVLPRGCLWVVKGPSKSGIVGVR